MSDKKLVVIDIGTHKLEELKLLFAPSFTTNFTAGKWALKELIKSVLRFDFSRLPMVAKTLRGYRKTRNYSKFKDAKFICVEPNIDVYKPASTSFAEQFDVDYYPLAILGHDSKNDVEIVSLNMYEDTLSSSVYQKARLDTVSRLTCVGMTFTRFVDLLARDFGLSSEHQVLLRMNCEGAELGIVRALKDANLDVIGIIGSLADVRKIHGEDEYAEMLSILDEMGVHYQYLVGSNPNSWSEALASDAAQKTAF